MMAVTTAAAVTAIMYIEYSSYICGVKDSHDTDPGPTFRFKRFAVTDRRCGMKLGTDGVLLGAWTRLPRHDASKAVDAGAGCGIISLMLAQRFGRLDITGVEISPDACADMEDNFSASPWHDRLHAACAPFGPSAGCADMIVSNPPYFTSGELSPDRARAASRHAGSLSPAVLVDSAREMLLPGGSLSMITPPEIEDALLCRAAFARMYPRRICRVFSRRGKSPVRILWEFSTDDGPLEHSALTLRADGGAPTPEFHDLCKDFYLYF